MANETTMVYETEIPLPMSVADGSGISKGAILKLTDPMTASLADGDGDIVAGIAASEKIANDGKTTLGVYRGGIFKATANGGISAGDALITNATTGATNEVATAGINAENIVGTALETATDGDTLLIELKPITMKLS